jgi:hypothetical protein
MNALGKMFGVHASAILKWIRRCATAYDVKPDPTGKAIILDSEEMGHCLKKTVASCGSGRLLLVIQAHSLTGRVGVVLRHP